MSKIKNKYSEKKKISIWSILSTLAFIPIIALVVFTLYSIWLRKGNDDVNSAKMMIKEIRNIRVAIDEYYKETGTFPDLSLANEDPTLEKISVKKDDKIIYFKDFLKEKEMPATPNYLDLDESNKVYLVENFNKDLSNNGGWNYNIKTGEIHANLPNNFFEQGIEWNKF